jgi:hypothetical protein
MIYTCRCTDGPAKGEEFQDYGPSVVVEVPYRGQILRYYLISVLDRWCIYRFRGPSDREHPSPFFPLSTH